MARSKKKKCSKKSRATVPHKESLGIRTLLSDEMRRLYRATVAWLRHLAAVLRQAFASAGAAVASNAALIAKRNRVGHGVPPTRERVEASDFMSVSAPAYKASDSVPRLAPSPATPPPPTGAKNCGSKPPPPTGAKNCASGSQASGSASAPASKSSDSASSPTTGAKNSGSQASGSAPAPASKTNDPSSRLALKPATLPPPTGSKNSRAGSQASGSTPLAGARSSDFPVPGTTSATTIKGLNITYHQDNPFSDGYYLSSLFEEAECLVVEEDALIYARFCSKRATFLLKKREICHICYFRHGKVFHCTKEELENHCRRVHDKRGGFLCKKQGCFIRTFWSGEVGRHYYYCHEKHRDWWVECLKLHGEM